MIHLKNSAQITAMKDAGRITGEALLVARDMVRPGVSTYEIDEAIRRYIEKCGAKPAFLGYAGFPASACISVNDEVIHGIPSSRILLEGDIVKIDVGAFYRGYHGDSARSFPVGRVGNEALRLIEVTKQSFFDGMNKALVGGRIGDIGNAVESCVKNAGYTVVRQYIGHGVGTELHEDPEVPNFGTAGRGVRMYPGMTIAIEPMVNAGGHSVRVLSNDWTVVTIDGSLSAHYENTVAVTENGPLNMTDVGDG